MLKLTGHRFGRLVVVDRAGTDGTNHATWNCKCDCGADVVVAGTSLKAGITRSCGCLVKEAKPNLKHGHFGSPTYVSWCAMIQRCTNEKHVAFSRYGGAGITICQRWRDSFEAFLADMGERPSGRYSIERKDGTKGYEPNNCKWATRAEQQSNTKAVRRIEIDGAVDTARGWSRRTGISADAIRNRIDKGMSPKDAIALPVNPIGRHSPIATRTAS